MSATVTAILAGMLLWWFSTGIILVAVRLAERMGQRGGHQVTMLCLPLLFLGGLFYVLTLGDTGEAGAYTAFVAALALWGWVELAFLNGTITGPVKRPCPPGRDGFERFMRAWGAIAYHEVALAVLLLFVVTIGAGAPNGVGLWTVVILYFARVSAKLNLFFGVPHINTEFLPRHLTHLASHFRYAKMNMFFPVSVTVLSFALYCWIDQWLAVETPGAEVGFALLGTITALALLEHWLMILNLPDAKLWRWMLPQGQTLGRKPKTTTDDYDALD